LARWAGPIWSEGLIVVLGLVGIYAAVRGKVAVGGNVPLVRFLALYTVLMLVAYSVIPYKTPWCVLGALHGLILLAGVGVVVLLQSARRRVVKAGLATALLAGSVQLGWQAQRASGETFCNSERNPYVYAQTLRDTVDLSRQLDQLAQIHPDGRRLRIHVIVENCWPLPWYLRAFKHVGYWETVPDAPDADVILASSKLEPELAGRLKQEYEVRQCGLRRDERLAVYVRQELWNAWLARLRGSADASSQPSSQ
jgi:predicted membrane-bound mannosyltransferase